MYIYIYVPNEEYMLGARNAMVENMVYGFIGFYCHPTVCWEGILKHGHKFTVFDDGIIIHNFQEHYRTQLLVTVGSISQFIHM